MLTHVGCTQVQQPIHVNNNIESVSGSLVLGSCSSACAATLYPSLLGSLTNLCYQLPPCLAYARTCPHAFTRPRYAIYNTIPSFVGGKVPASSVASAMATPPPVRACPRAAAHAANLRALRTAVAGYTVLSVVFQVCSRVGYVCGYWFNRVFCAGFYRVFRCDTRSMLFCGRDTRNSRPSGWLLRTRHLLLVEDRVP